MSSLSARKATEGRPGSTRWCAGAMAARVSVLLQLLYSKLTEYLEDFHLWASVVSRPAGRGPLHTPRLSATFTLLCAHACVAALVAAIGHEQVGPFPHGGSHVPARLCAPFLTRGLANQRLEGGYSGEGDLVNNGESTQH